jgi:uncharacterized membrane protein YphA (DoxX/SURF4 family)
MKSIGNKLPLVARLLLGLIFFVFGLNGFFHFLPMPPMQGAPASFMGALAATGYMFPLIKGTEVVAGLALLSGRAVPLALTLLAPVIVNITLFHVVLAPSNFGMIAFLLAAEIYLAWAYRDSFRGVLNLQAQPTVGADSVELASKRPAHSAAE